MNANYENAIKDELKLKYRFYEIDRGLIKEIAKKIRNKHEFERSKLPSSKGWLDKFIFRNKVFLDSLCTI